MFAIRILLVTLAMFVCTVATRAQLPDRAGWWKFDDPSAPQKPVEGFGVNLEFTGIIQAANGPVDGDGAILIPQGSYIKMKHQLKANGGGVFVNEYSISFDFMVQQTSSWHSFFQTNTGNSNDGDFFINPSGNIGVAAVGYSSYSVIPAQWYRMVISVQNGSFFNCYLDGKLILSGKPQTVDGRFSLEDVLLLFADDNGEDGEIYCSELSVWGQALSAAQARELGGYNHDVTPMLMTRVPFLQSPSQTSIVISWHDEAQTNTRVEWHSESSGIINTTFGTSEIISEPFNWHTVKLTGLKPGTRYLYQVASGDGISDTFSFKTLPDTADKGKMRFLVLGDTYASDTLMTGKIMRAVRTKLIELYGQDFENKVNGVFHTGDVVVSGSAVAQYTWQFFKPLSAVSANIPIMAVAGNHEGENSYFYSYMKLDDLSAFPANPDLNEKIWSLKAGNGMFIGLNTNIVVAFGASEANWFESKLKEAELDPATDFVFVFFHHPPFSELWKDVNTFDEGSNYVRDILTPIMLKYSKVQEIHFGHTHGYETGTITSMNGGNDFRIVCGGGGGGPLDPWSEGAVSDIPDINATISNYNFQIIETDPANHLYTNTVYSLGTPSHPQNTIILDQWHKNLLQPAPSKPQVIGAAWGDEGIGVISSAILGNDSVMSCRLQVIDSSLSKPVVLDTIAHWRNIFGVDADENPVDLNKNVSLYRMLIKSSRLSANKSYQIRIRYRDQNMKWSEWSSAKKLSVTGTETGMKSSSGFCLEPNYPNPFGESTLVTYHLPERSKVTFRIYDLQNRLVDVIDQGLKPGGTYQFIYKPKFASNNVLICKMMVANNIIEQKWIKTR